MSTDDLFEIVYDAAVAVTCDQSIAHEIAKLVLRQVAPREKTPAEMKKPRKNKWGGRLFTPEQWLKRDIRSAQTRSAKSGVKPTLPKLKCLEEDEAGE